MNERVRLRLRESIREIRLHARRFGTSPGPAAAQRLRDLADGAAVRADESAALRRCLDRLAAETAALPRLVSARLDAVAALATELGLRVAREIVGEIVERGDFDPTATVKSCLASMVTGNDTGDVRVLLAAADLPIVMARVQDIPSAEPRAIRFAVDPSLPRGSVRIETAAGSMRHDPREVCDRVAAAIREELSA